MKRPSILVLPCLMSLVLGGACRESKPLPPGNWTGRCPASSDREASTEFGPPPTTFVRDRARLFSSAFALELERTLSAFQLETCHHLMVVSVDSLEGSTLASYSLQYANRIGLGYRRLNNGLMLLMAPETRQARIQIGCGLEDVISDQQANEIMRRELIPAFDEGSWEQAVRASLASLMALARKKPIAEGFRPEGCRRPDASEGQRAFMRD
jgi:uncharacterized membrane protein YgcG